MNEINKRKKEIFDKYKDKIKWEEVDKEDKKCENKIWKEEYDIEFARKYNLDTNTLNELKNLKSSVLSGSEFIAKLKERFERQDKLQRFLDDYKMEFLWKNRNLTEEIAPEIIANYDSVEIKKGTINIIVSLSLEPFFRKTYEVKFQEVRLSKKWGEFIGFDEESGEGTLCDTCKTGIFTYDKRERELEKDGYDIEAFRGIAFNELLTPIYKLNKNKVKEIFDEKEKDISEERIKDDTKREFFKFVFGKIKGIVNDWDIIKVKITKGGLANIFFEKDFKDCDIKDFAVEKRKLMRSPYSEKEMDKIKNSIIDNIHESNKGVEFLDKVEQSVKEFLKKNKLLKREQVFTSYLNAAAIWITHIFLRECEVYKKVAEILGINKKKEWTDYLEYPWGVRYKAIATVAHNTPPIRNYCVVFRFNGVKGISWGFDKPLKIERHFDCPADITNCPKKEECFIRFLGHSLLALSINTYIVDEGCSDPKQTQTYLRPWFTQKELENLAKRDLSRWRGELCLVESETIVICTSEESEKHEIDMEGQEIKYDKYWASIIKGFSLLLGCKTLAQDIGRLLLDCIWQHRNKLKDVKEIQETLNTVSHLLSRTRFTATPSNISRAKYVREKFEAYIEATGLSEIIKNIGDDYDELHAAIHSSIEIKGTKAINWLTFFLVVLTIPITIGTAVLVRGEVCVQNIKKYAVEGIVITLCIVLLWGICFLFRKIWKQWRLKRRQ